MEPNFRFIASSSTDAELIERIDNRKNYLPETVEASLAELQYRKHEFSEDEVHAIIEAVSLQRANAELVDSKLGTLNSKVKNVIVLDPQAPKLYSRRALYFFTVLCGALFGSVMLAINLISLGKAINALWAVLFGIIFTVVQIYILSNYANGSGSGGAIIGGFIASYILDYFFWRPFIGYATFYRTKPIWIPLAIAVFVFALLFAAIIYGK